jgi:predicted N-acyltransferase
VAAPGRYGGASFREGLGPESARLARDSLIDAVERQSRQDEAAAISWLYLFQGEDPLLETALSARGYEDMILDAECYLPLDQGSFDGYLSNFRAEYRRKIRYEMAALEDSGAEVAMFGGEALGLELATLERQWRVKYGRTPPVEEIVADYHQLYEHMGDKLRVFVAHKDGKALGFSVFLEDGKTWYSRFGGFDYSAGNLFLYFNLLFYHPLRTMYEKKVEVARYSLKSYEAKRSRGCLLRHVLAYIKAPEGWPSLRPALELIDRAQSARFAEISNRSITKDQAP